VPALELAKYFDFVATLLAAFAVFAGLFVAVIGSNNTKVTEVPGAALLLALFGVAVFIFGRVVRYQFVGY
jgi:Sec-independent protein secretion pathway component TatC